MTVHLAPEMCLYVAGKWEATIDANNSGGEMGFVFAKSANQFHLGKGDTVDRVLHAVGCNDNGIIRLSVGSLNCSLQKDLNSQLYHGLFLRILTILMHLQQLDFILAYN